MKKVPIERQLQGESIVDLLDDETLGEISRKVETDYKTDKDSRQGWEERNREGLKLALQVAEEKSFPWPKAANVKYPLITMACMQYNARALPTLTNRGKPFGYKVVGSDPTGQKKVRAERRSTYLNYRHVDKGGWLDDHDELQMVVGLVGVAYKKTYFSPPENRVRSEFVHPNNLVKNYWAKDFDKARKTHVLYFDRNDIVTRVRSGRFSEIDLDELKEPKAIDDQNRDNEDDARGFTRPNNDSPFECHEHHTWYDLDKDGYAEPLVITTMDEKVVRIVPRYDPEGVEYNDEGEVVSIVPIEYFTEYPFIPSPDGSSMPIGFGLLLGSISGTVDTLINQLIDAGTLQNTPPGFAGRGLRIKGGEVKTAPGRMNFVNSTGDDIKKNLFFLDVPQPSAVLFQMLGLLVQAGQDIGSTQDIMLGKTPGQNTPATTSMAALDQGLKVYAAIFRRQYEAQQREQRKIYLIEKTYLDMEDYASVLDAYVMTEQGPQPVPPQELAADWEAPIDDICPAADPEIVSDIQRMAKAESIAARASVRPDIYNPYEVEKLYLMALGEENFDSLITQPAPPEPDLQLQFDMQKWADEKEIRISELQLNAAKLKADIAKRTAEVGKIEAQARSLDNTTVLDAQKYAEEAEVKRVELIEQRLEALRSAQQKDRELSIKEREVNAKTRSTTGDKASK